MSNDKQLFKAIFMIQVLAAFLVTAGHYTAGLGSYTTITGWETALNHISRFGTVILAMLTGFFTAHSFQYKQPTAFSFFKGKFLYIFIPFIAAGFLYHSILTPTYFPTNLKDLAMIAVGRTGGHLYFIFMIMQYYVFAFLFRKWITKRNIWWFLLVFLGIQFAFIDYNLYWRGFGVRYFLPTWIFTIYLGHMLYWYRHAIIGFIQKQRWLLIVLLLSSAAGTTFFALSEKLYTANHIRFVLFTAVLLVTLTYLFLQLVKRFSLPFHKGITYYIYLLHPYLIIRFNLLFMRDLELNWILDYKVLSLLYLGLIFAATYGLSWLISLLIGYLASPKASMKQKKKLSVDA